MAKGSPMAIKYNSYKVEFALRGAAHIHGVLWMDWKNLQGFDSKDIEAIEAVFKKIRDDECIDIEEEEKYIRMLADAFITV